MGAALPLVKFLKVDYRSADGDALAALARLHKGNGLQLLAEKVETQAEVNQARALGYSFFQGYFFCKPSMLSTREISANKLVYLHLLQAVSSPDFSREKVEELLNSDPSLVYELLRYLNSPLLGLRGEIHSIREAMESLGEIEFALVPHPRHCRHGRRQTTRTDSHRLDPRLFLRGHISARRHFPRALISS
jgi:c-di-GMP-related signal transduction protein